MEKAGKSLESEDTDKLKWLVSERKRDTAGAALAMARNLQYVSYRITEGMSGR